MSSKQLNRKYYLGIIKTFGIYILASICCIIFKKFYFGTEYGIKTMIVGILNYTADDYAWYIEMYIGLFLIIPFLNLAYHGLKNKRQKLLLLGTMLFMTSFHSLFYIVTDCKILPEYWNSIYPITFYFIGAYLKEYGMKIGMLKKVLLLVGMIIVAGAVSYYKSYGMEFVWGAWSSYSSIIVICMTVLVFEIIRDITLWDKLSDFWKKVLKQMSDCALGAYLLSYIFDSIVYPYFVNRVPNFSYRLGYYFICVPIVLICSMLGAAILNYMYEMIYKLMTKVFVAIRNKFA